MFARPFSLLPLNMFGSETSLSNAILWVRCVRSVNAGDVCLVFWVEEWLSFYYATFSKASTLPLFRSHSRRRWIRLWLCWRICLLLSHSQTGSLFSRVPPHPSVPRSVISNCCPSSFLFSRIVSSSILSPFCLCLCYVLSLTNLSTYIGILTFLATY